MNNFKSNFYYKYLYFMTFAVFIIVTTVISYFLTNYISENTIQEEVSSHAKKEFFIKEKIFESFTEDLDENVLSLVNSKIFIDYSKTRDENSIENVESLFLSYCNGLRDVMQVRFIDLLGKEEVRVEKQNGTCYASENLQYKAVKDYFLGAKLLQKGAVLRSDIDLNRENGLIQEPKTPTLRVSTPVFLEKELVGVVVINYFAEEFLNTFTASSSFDISLANHDGDFIVYKSLENKRSFGKDYKSLYSLEKELEKESVYSFNLNGLTAVFESKDEFLEYIDTSKNSVLSSVIFSFFIVSIPVGLLLSFIPISLNKKLQELNLQQSMLIDIVDKNIYYTDTDIDGNIRNVSHAFLDKMGYSIGEVVGEKPSFFKAEYPNNVNVEDIISTVANGKKWEGEIINYTKDGEKVFFHTTVAPQINKKTGKVESLSSIKVDITDKKRIEELSVTDALTGLYNRRYYKKIVEKELKRSRRDNKFLTFMMMDIDHFKLYNDTYGHQMGDCVLKDVSAAIKECLNRPSDFCFRMGGEEFAVLVSDLDQEHSLLFAEKILNAIRSLNIEHSKNSAASFVTASLGMIVVNPRHDVIDEEALYKLSDNALYEAKTGGRNRLHLHENDELELF